MTGQDTHRLLSEPRPTARLMSGTMSNFNNGDIGDNPAECTIRLVLDNHSAHISQETRAFLASKPNRFKYVLTPTHGSWLNIVETLFGKMARTFLRHVRVQSWEELRDRILKGIEEINADPVVHRWRKFEALTEE